MLLPGALLCTGCTTQTEPGGDPPVFSVQPGGVLVQLTDSPQNHFMSPFGPFSPDGQWIVYDTRDDETAMGRNGRIEHVNTQTGRKELVYQTPGQTQYGPGCGTASYSPVENKIVFIHGILRTTAERPYDFTRRMGAAVAPGGKMSFIDARDVTPPFTSGALRGGTHAHEWSGDGNWIGFTYNDQIMAKLEKDTGRPADLRTVGVSANLRPVTVDKDQDGENNDGLWYSVVVARVTPDPAAGSDQISRAFENAWVGKLGYRKEDGSMQRAQAFLGRIRTADGRDVDEVFIVDIPDRIDAAGHTGPLEGTAAMMPQPPQGCVQRRLTFTAHKRYPGAVSMPRHWVFSSACGEYIGFLAKDDAGIVQLCTVSPRGGDPLQITRHTESIESTFSWHPTEPVVCYAAGGSIYLCRIDTGKPMPPKRLTQASGDPVIYPCWSPDGRSIAFCSIPDRAKNTHRQIFLLRLTTDY
jgi:hypothetical protein